MGGEALARGTHAGLALPRVGPVWSGHVLSFPVVSSEGWSVHAQGVGAGIRKGVIRFCQRFKITLGNFYLKPGIRKINQSISHLTPSRILKVKI